MQTTYDEQAVDELVDALLWASRALVGVAARSIAAADDAVTLPQYRVLVVLWATGPQSMKQLSAELALHQSTATRMCDRLVAKGLIERGKSATNRREVHVALAPGGRDLVDRVTAVRRDEIRRIVARIAEASRDDVVAAMSTFAAAAGEPRQPGWTSGWT